MSADRQFYALATNASANGASVALRGGNYLFMAEGTVGGSTISLQIQNPNGNWCDISVMAGYVVKSTTLPFVQTSIELPPGNVRMAITGGAATGVNAWLSGI